MGPRGRGAIIAHGFIAGLAVVLYGISGEWAAMFWAGVAGVWGYVAWELGRALTYTQRAAERWRALAAER